MVQGPGVVRALPAVAQGAAALAGVAAGVFEAIAGVEEHQVVGLA